MHLHHIEYEWRMSVTCCHEDGPASSEQLYAEIWPCVLYSMCFLYRDEEPRGAEYVGEQEAED